MEREAGKFSWRMEFKEKFNFAFSIRSIIHPAHPAGAY
jgi:hypothetical protein